MNFERAAKLRPLLSVRRLRIDYPQRRRWSFGSGSAVRAVDSIDFDLNLGEALAIIGERSSGRSALARILSGTEPDGVAAGSARFRDHELIGAGRDHWRQLRPQIQRIAEIDPAKLPRARRTALGFVSEALRPLPQTLPKDQCRIRASEALAAVGLNGEMHNAMIKTLGPIDNRRVAIAAAIACSPQLLILDDLLSGLDTEQASALIPLLQALRRNPQLAFIQIEQRFDVLLSDQDRALVLCWGRIQEQGRASDLVAQPRHPYTRALIGGELTAMTTPKLERGHAPLGCVFHPRCPLAEHACVQTAPGLRRLHGDHYVACHFVAGS